MASNVSHLIIITDVQVCVIVANEDRQYIHDTVCKIKVQEFVPKSGKMEIR